MDRNGTPAAFVWIPGEDSGGEEDQRVECWRLDTGTRVNTRLPGTVRAVFDDADITWMVLGEPDGSLVIRPLFPDRR